MKVDNMFFFSLIINRLWIKYTLTDKDTVHFLCLKYHYTDHRFRPTNGNILCVNSFNWCCFTTALSCRNIYCTETLVFSLYTLNFVATVTNAPSYTYMDLLLLAADKSTPIDYMPIVVQLFVAIGFVVVTMLASHILGPKRKTADKLINFESGIPSVGNARQPLAIKYFLVAILFVLFDVEVIFFYPYAVNFRDFSMDPELGKSTFMAVVLFVAFFLTGFIYIIKKGALDWED